MYVYQVPVELVQAIISIYNRAKAIYNRAKAGHCYANGQLIEKNSFNLSVEVLQGDSLAPYLFVIVIDFVSRPVMVEECETLINKKMDTTRRGTPALYFIDLHVLSPTTSKIQNLVENAAVKVGFLINK